MNTTGITWQRNYAEAKAFFDEHGHFPTYKENSKLRQWANKIYKEMTRSGHNKKEQLRAIGYEPHEKWKLWNQNYAEAKRIYEETGHTPTYKAHPRLFKYFKHWMMNSGNLHPDRLAMLSNIGYKVDGHGHIWQKNYAEAKAFFDRYGHFPTPQENIRLFMWARGWIQRHAHEQPEQVDALRQIGFNR